MSCFNCVLTDQVYHKRTTVLLIQYSGQPVGLSRLSSINWSSWLIKFLGLLLSTDIILACAASGWQRRSVAFGGTILQSHTSFMYTNLKRCIEDKIHRLPFDFPAVVTT